MPNAQQEAVAFWKLLEELGLRPSVRKIAALMRLAGLHVDDHAVRVALEAFAERAPHPKATRRKITAQPPHKHRTKQAQTPHKHRTPTALYAGDKVSLVSKLIPLPDGNGLPTHSSREDDVRPPGSGTLEPEWVENLRRNVSAIDKLPLGELTLEQRVVLGQYHAYRFEHYVTSKARCVNRGSRHITPLADIGRLAHFRAMTVAEYRGHLQRLMVTSGALVRSPWAIKGAVEDDA